MGVLVLLGGLPKLDGERMEAVMTQHLVLKVITKLMLVFIILFALYVRFHGDYSLEVAFKQGNLRSSVYFVWYGNGSRECSECLTSAGCS